MHVSVGLIPRGQSPATRFAAPTRQGGGERSAPMADFMKHLTSPAREGRASGLEPSVKERRHNAVEFA